MLIICLLYNRDLFLDSHKIDTWIFPLIQMGEFNINLDEHATCTILGTVPKGGFVRLATGYFNLTEKYARTLLIDCKSNISLLMAHPNVSILLYYTSLYL